MLKVRKIIAGKILWIFILFYDEENFESILWNQENSEKQDIECMTYNISYMTYNMYSMI